MKLQLIPSIVLLASTVSYADFQFGTETYQTAGQTLVVNSLGDQSTISEFITPTQSLGTNDFIPENAEKNLLATMGYTQAWDTNPNAPVQYTADNGSNPYGTPPPANVAVTPITFMGLAGDPRSAQTVYVPTAQYDALSNQSLNTRELTDATSITNTNTTVTNVQQSLATNTSQIAVNSSNIHTLNTNLINTDVTVNNLVTTTNGLGNEVTTLYTGIGNEQVRAEGVEGGLQNQINTANAQTASLEDNVHKLNEVKVIADLNIRILDTKKYSVGLFDMYDGAHQRNFAFGARLTYKLGKSYEERLLEKQLQQIEMLEAAVGRLQGR